MNQPSDKITKFLIFFVIAVFIIKSLSNAGIFEARSHKGRGYYVAIPTGWKKVKKRKNVIYPKDVEVVMFVPKEFDLKKAESDVYISIFAKKLETPIWIEDEFPDILKSIAKAGMVIKDRGEVKLDDKIFYWVVYHNKSVPALVLEFYMVTDTSLFYKIQYSAEPQKFNKYRPSFEELKESFKFRFSLY